MAWELRGYPLLNNTRKIYTSSNKIGMPSDGSWSDGAAPINPDMTIADAVDSINEYIKNEDEDVIVHFTKSDWVLVGIDYKFDIIHNYNADVLIQVVDENTGAEVGVTIIPLNANEIRLVISADPDMRFDGRAIIEKVD